MTVKGSGDFLEHSLFEKQLNWINRTVGTLVTIHVTALMLKPFITVEAEIRIIITAVKSIPHALVTHTPFIYPV